MRSHQSQQSELNRPGQGECCPLLYRDEYDRLRENIRGLFKNELNIFY
jgi:hypothetical protein